jgi:uncharacterized membrane protein
VAIYWVNHHRMFHFASRVTNGLVWSNIALLFALSLVPFATAYLGEHAFSAEATLVYMCVMMLPAIAYVWLQIEVRRTGRQDAAAQDYHKRMLRKGVVTSAMYVAGIPLTFAVALARPGLRGARRGAVVPAEEPVRRHCSGRKRPHQRKAAGAVRPGAL